MYRDYVKTRLAVFLAVLALPGVLVAGVCLTPADEATNPDPLETGFAVAIQSDQGQGSIDCSAFTGPGGEMSEVDVDQDQTVGPVSDPIFWWVPSNVADPENQIHADIVFIGNSDGSRCTQYYKANARSGFAAAGTKTNKDATLVACSDLQFEEVPPVVVPPEAPVSTADGRCGDITSPDDSDLQEAINNNGKYDVVIAIGRGEKGDNTAICSDNTVGAQKRCVDQCITPDPINVAGTPEYIPEDERVGTVCEDPLLAFYPLKCRVCELSSVIDSDPFVDGVNGSPKFCWEQLQKVRLSGDEPPPVVYSQGEFKKAPGPKSNQVWKVDEYAGSTCYKISGTTDYGYRYAYWVPSGCPK